MQRKLDPTQWILASRTGYWPHGEPKEGWNPPHNKMWYINLNDIPALCITILNKKLINSVCKLRKKKYIIEFIS